MLVGSLKHPAQAAGVINQSVETKAVKGYVVNVVETKTTSEVCPVGAGNIDDFELFRVEMLAGCSVACASCLTVKISWPISLALRSQNVAGEGTATPGERSTPNICWAKAEPR
jgi:hypothetical protein